MDQVCDFAKKMETGLDRKHYVCVSSYINDAFLYSKVKLLCCYTTSLFQFFNAHSHNLFVSNINLPHSHNLFVSNINLPHSHNLFVSNINLPHSHNLFVST